MRVKKIKRCLQGAVCLFVGLLGFLPAVQGSAMEAKDLMFTVQGLYAHPLSPQHYIEKYGGAGLDISMERMLDDKWSFGVALSQINFRKGGGGSSGFSSLDLIVRRFMGEWHGLNPYGIVGVGADVFRDNLKDPFGDVLNVQLRAGSLYVMSNSWAIDYGMGYHLLAPMNEPYSFADVRLGLNYRFGMQPKVNLNRPLPVVAQQMNVTEMVAPPTPVGTALPTPMPTPEPTVVAPVEPEAYDYTVKRGDCLYKIAGKTTSIGSSVLWPLIYRENEETVENPHRIYPGQVLQVRRQYDPEERRKALNEGAKIIKENPKP
jgi:LysM repeat protein